MGDHFFLTFTKSHTSVFKRVIENLCLQSITKTFQDCCIYRPGLFHVSKNLNIICIGNYIDEMAIIMGLLTAKTQLKPYLIMLIFIYIKCVEIKKSIR